MPSTQVWHDPPSRETKREVSSRQRVLVTRHALGA